MNQNFLNFTGGLTPKAPTVSVTDVERPYQFEQISADGKLWAAVYSGQDKNAVQELLEKWNDPNWVADYFANANPQGSWYDLSTSGKAWMAKITGCCAGRLDRDLKYVQKNGYENSYLWREAHPYHTYQTCTNTLLMTKIKPLDWHDNERWLRIYGVETADGCTVITGGGIKLIKDLRDDPLLKAEGEKAKKMYDYLRGGSVFDHDSFQDFTSTEGLVYPR